MTGKPAAARSRHIVISLLLAGLALVLHGATRATIPDGFDSADFALAVGDFDVTRLQPHFPGYPVYIALARVTRLATGLTAVESLSLTGIVLAALAVIPLLSIGRRLVGEGGAIFMALIWIVAPLAWLQAVRPTSDAAGASFLFAAAAVLLPGQGEKRPSRRRLAGGAALLGLGLGVRPSAFAFLPLVVAAALWGAARGTRARSLLLGVAGMAVGLALWILPLVSHEGLAALAGEGSRFVRGHFQDWGGTGEPVQALPRAAAFWRDGIAGGFGGIWPADLSTGGRATLAAGLLAAAATALGILAAARGAMRLFRRRRREPLPARALATFSLPYAAWLLAAQNPAEPRHVLPLLPVAAALAWAGMPSCGGKGPGRRLPMRIPLAGILAASCLAAALPRMAEYRELAPAARVAQRVARHAEHEDVRLYGGSAARVLRYLDPRVDARLARNLRSARRDLAGSLYLPGLVLFAGSAPPGAAAGALEAGIPGATALVACYEADPMVFGKEARLGLWRIDGGSSHDGP